MLNAVIVVSVALFGVSAGAVLGTRARAGRRFQATPGAADIGLLAAVMIAAYLLHVHIWRHWLNFAGWLAVCVAGGTAAQWIKPAPRMAHRLTQ